MKKNNHGLNENQLKIICRILIPFIDYIDRISLFGSRATGFYKPNSDIDMVIYGSIDEKMTNRISTMFNDSYLPLKVDVHSYNLISYQPLKEHIDNNALPLFTAEQIKSISL